MKKTILSILFTMGIFSLSLFAQWETLPDTNIPDSFGGDAQCIATGGGKIFVGLKNNGVFMSSDNGENWTDINTGLNPASVFAILVEQDTVYLALNRTGVFKSATDNINWIEIVGGEQLPDNKNYTSLAKLGNTLFLGTMGDFVYSTDLTTISWSKSSSNLHKDIYCLLTDTTNSRVLAGTGDKNNISVFADGSWEKYNNPIDATVRSLEIANNKLLVGANNGLYIGDLSSISAGSYTAELQTNNIPQETILGLVATEDQVFAAVFGYTGGSPGVYVATSGDDSQLSFEKIINGVVLPRPVIRGLAATENNIWAAIEGSGPYNLDAAQTTWTLEANGIPKETTINLVMENNEKLYALTSIGVFESPSGEGGDWEVFDMEGWDVRSYLFAESGSKYAIANGVLFKNGEIVAYDTGDDYPLDSELIGLTSLMEYYDEETQENYIFVGSWAAGFDGYAGIYKTSDDGVTWSRYGEVTSEENTPGFHENNRILAHSWAAASDGTIFTPGKHVIQISEDLGDTFFWRKGNNNMPHWGTTSNVVTRTYNGKEYLFMGMEDYWYVGRSEIGEEVGTVWENADGSSSGNKAPKRPTLTNYSDNLLFATARTGNQIMKTEDNGDNWFAFDTGIENKTGLQPVTVGNEYIYTSGAGKMIYRYDMTSSPAWTMEPAVENIDYTSAEIVFGSSHAGTFYYVILAQGADQPTVEQIMAGNDVDDEAALFAGSKPSGVQNTDTVFLSDLDPGNDYQLFAFVKGEVLNNSTLSTATFSTDEAAEITFSVTDGTNPLPGITIHFNDASLSTDASGLAVFENVIPANGLIYSINETGYLPLESSIDVTGSATINVELTAVYSVTFVVSNNVGLMSDALVEFNNEEITTSLDGEAIFNDVTQADDMPYTVSKEGYLESTGTLSVNADITENVTLERIPVCDVPADPETTNIEGTSALLSWSAGSEGTIDELGYDLRYKQAADSDWSTIFVEDTQYQLDQLTEGTEYEWQVNANCTEGDEDWSNSVWSEVQVFRTESTLDCGNETPENPATLFVTSNSARLSWDNISGVSYFEVQYRMKGITTWSAQTSASSAVTIESLESETTYEWQVRSVCEGTQTESPWTDMLEFTTLEAGSSGGGSASNPIASFYGKQAGYPTWTDRINWTNSINMAEYDNGNNDFEKFENARDELYEQGGGVLYYPGGEYDFTDAPVESVNGRGLLLKKGVVILGDAPEGDADATDGSLELTTKFNFKFIEKGGGEVPAPFNMIGLMPDQEELREVDDVGIAWVHLNGATVYWGFQMDMGDTYGTSDAWLTSRVKDNWKARVPDGTYIMDIFCGQAEKFQSPYEGAGKGRFVFGCQMDNAVWLNDVYDRGFGATGFSEFKYGGRIAVYGSQVFIANNAITKSDKNFLYEQLTSEGQKMIIFDYAFNTGIDVNKNNVNVAGNRLAPESGYYEEGVVVQDNYIYNHGFKTMDGSGNWVTVKNNYGARDLLSPGEDTYGLGNDWTLTGDGFATHATIGSSDAFQNRAYDMAGKNMWIDSNYYENVGTIYPSNDGEGILAQRHGGTDIMSWAITNNLGTGGYRPGYIGGYDVHNFGCLISWNSTEGTVGHIKAASNSLIDVSFVDNISAGVTTDCGGDCDYITDCPTGDLTPPADATVTLDEENYRFIITWTDATDQEIGYRIDRRIAGDDNWTTIVYRPRYSDGHEMNEQKWIDYMAPAGEMLEYRVVAVNCDNSDEGASETLTACFPVKMANPVFSPSSGEYTEAQSVKITSNDEGAEIRYTINGDDPDETSELYSGPIVIDSNITLKARAYKDCNEPSDIVSATYAFTTGIETEYWENSVNLYPNPGKDVVWMSIDNQLTGSIHIRLSDLLGRTIENYVFDKQTSGFTRSIDIHSLNPGIYYLEINMDQYKVIRKFIKE